LEWWYTAPPPPGADADAIVVLSGAHTTARYQHAAWLYTHWRNLPVLACVGSGETAGAADTCATRARKILNSGGVPSSMIWLEERSATTHENAMYAADMLRRKRLNSVVLVTEAFHMLRAEMCFRRQGLKVIPAPCLYRSARFIGSASELVPRPAYLRENRDALREWIGLAWYLTRGYV
jgi:uncharacterized SAM-binding protein YcdF (DUF218 family)